MLDNASIHKTKKVKQYCAENDIELAYNVPYQPQFAAIEECWAMAKNNFKRRILKMMINQEEQTYLRQAVIDSLRTLEN